MQKKPFLIAFRAALLLSIAGLLAWIFGEPLIFPSIGPTAYVLAFSSKRKYSARVILGGHLCGATGGLISYNLIVSPNHLHLLSDPLSQAGLALVGGSVLALFLTVLFMLAFSASHPPACATTLIISLGILSTWMEVFLIMLAVLFIYLAYTLYFSYRRDTEGDYG